MFKKQILFISFVIITILTSTSLASVTIIPKEVNIEIIGGQSNTYQVNISNKNDHDIIIHLSTTVLPDDIGFYIDFSENGFVVPLKSNKTVLMNITTAISLMPTSYTINIIGDIKEQTNGQSHRTTAIGTRNTEQNKSNETEDSQNEQEPQDNETVFIPQTTITKSDFSVPYLVAIPIIGLFLLFVFLYANRKKKEKKEEK